MKLLKRLLALLFVAALIFGFFIFKDSLLSGKKPDKQDLAASLNQLAEAEPQDAAQAAGDLIRRAKESDLAPEDAKRAIQDWLKDQEPEVREKIIRRLDDLSKEAGSAIEEEAAALLRKLDLSADPADWLDALKNFLNID